MRLFRFVAAIGVAAVLAAALVVSATAEGVPLFAGGTASVVGNDGPGIVGFAVSGTEPATVPWISQPAAGFFAYTAETEFAGSPAIVYVAIEQMGFITAFCESKGGSRTDTTVVFASTTDGGHLLVTGLDGRRLVDEAVYVKVYLTSRDHGPSRITLGTDDGSGLYTMWLADTALLGHIELQGAAGLSCG